MNVYLELAEKIEARITRARSGLGGNVAAVHYHADNDESVLVLKALREVDSLRAGIRAIARACVDGRVCDDVAWFMEIPATTLFDWCELVLDEELPRHPDEAVMEEKTMLKRLMLAAACCVVFAMPAAAVDFTTPLVDLDGKPFVDDKGDPVKDFTLGRLCKNALLANYPDEQIDGAEKVRRFELATKINNAKNPQLSAEDIALIKRLVAKGYAAAFVGPAWKLLDPPK